MAKSASPDLHLRAKQLEELQKRYAGRYVVVDLKTIRIDEETFTAIKGQMGKKFLRDNKVLPLFRNGNTLSVAMVDPEDIQVADAITQKTGLSIDALVTIPKDIEIALDYSFKQTEAALPLPDLDDTEGIPPDTEAPGPREGGRDVLT